MPPRWPANSPRNSASRWPVGARLGDDVGLTATMTLRAYTASWLGGEPQPHDHGALRWVSAEELDDLAWVPADRGCLPALTSLTLALRSRVNVTALVMERLLLRPLRGRHSP